MTEDKDPSAFITQEAVSFSSQAAVFPFGRNGALQAEVRVSSDHTFPRLGIDLSGTRIKLGAGGDFEATVLGATYSHGSSPTSVDVTAPELSWWITPRVDLRWRWVCSI